MPHKPAPDLDARTARLGRAWFAEVRRRQREEAAEETRRVPRRDSDTRAQDGRWDWLLGDGDGDADDA